MDHDTYSMAKDHMAGKEGHEPKRIHEIRIRKAGKGHIMEHHHASSHPMEEHATTGDDAMMSHIMEHMSSPNPGEAEADAGQSGAPDASAAAAPPSQMGATPPMAGA